MAPRPITPRQAEVLSCIRRHIEEFGWPPTYREICAKLGVTGTNGVSEHLRALKRKGFVEIHANQTRCIRILKSETGDVVVLRHLFLGKPDECADIGGAA